MKPLPIRVRKLSLHPLLSVSWSLPGAAGILVPGGTYENLQAREQLDLAEEPVARYVTMKDENSI